MDWREDRGTAAGTLLLVRFADAPAAERRVAGMSAAGRWAAVAHAAGGRHLLFVVEGASKAWSAAARDDFARAGLSGLPQQVAAADLDACLDEEPRGPLLLAAGRYLPDGDALAALLVRPRAAVTDAGIPVADEGAGEALSSSPGPNASDPALVVPVIDLEHPAAAVRRLVHATAKPSDGIVSRRFNRPISQRVSAMLLLHVPGIRPSHITLVVAAAAVLMVACFLSGSWTGFIAGGVLFHVASVIDGVDGEIARASYRSSVAGATLDTRVDVATNLGFFVGVAVSLTRLYGPRQAMIGGVVVLFGITGMVLLGWLARRAGRPGSLDVLKDYYRNRFPTGWQHRVTETLVAMTSRDFFAFAFGLIIVLGWGWTVSWLLAGFSAIWLVTIVCAIPGLTRGDGAALAGRKALVSAE